MSTYDLEFYSVVLTIRYWKHYLLGNEFIIYPAHEALKHLNSQKNLDHRHGRWRHILIGYHYVLKHKFMTEN